MQVEKLNKMQNKTHSQINELNPIQRQMNVTFQIESGEARIQ